MTPSRRRAASRVTGSALLAEAARRIGNAWLAACRRIASPLAPAISAASRAASR
jgi:hypothetical protein